MVFEENNPNLEFSPETGSTTSSDSYSYLLQDLEDPENTVKEEWEAIERTLYQESGKQIHNPSLLRECRLWSETFPHLRIRGKKIEGKKQSQEKGIGPESVTKCVQTTNANPPWVKLNEQRESIKKQVVGQLVQRLILKFNLSQENPTDVLQYFDKIELEKKYAEKKESKLNSSVPISTEKLEMECYFERGKLQSNNMRNQELANKRGDKFLNDYSDLSDHLEKEFSVRFLSNSMINEKNNLLKSIKSIPRSDQNFWRKDFDSERGQNMKPKNEGILKKEKKIIRVTETAKDSKIKTNQPLDSSSSLVKPFEATKKIDKKYEALLESILKNKGFNVPDPGGTNPKPESPKQEVKSYKESIEKLRVNTNYDEYMKRHKQLPKINNFTNNWMSRTDNYSFKDYNTAMEEFEKEQSVKCTKSSASSSTLQVPRNNWTSKSSTSTENGKRNGVNKEKVMKGCKNVKSDYFIEDVKTEVPNLFTGSNRNVEGKTHKSRSCGDLHGRRQDGSYNSGRNMKSGVEKKKSDVYFKNSSKLDADKMKSVSRTNFNGNVNFPPIENSIIVTELNGRPKMPKKIQPRIYS